MVSGHEAQSSDKTVRTTAKIGIVRKIAFSKICGLGVGVEIAKGEEGWVSHPSPALPILANITLHPES